MKLSSWAGVVGIAMGTALPRRRSGKLPVTSVRIGKLILVEKTEQTSYRAAHPRKEVKL
jgi:predicted site-specific integrase-resolvase